VNLAWRGSRQLTEKVEKIQDQAELARVQRQAREVMLKATLAAILLTLVALAIPLPA